MFDGYLHQVINIQDTDINEPPNDMIFFLQSNHQITLYK